MAIRREPHPSDFLRGRSFMRLIRRLKPDVLHGHGAKAGAFIRLKRRSETPFAFTRRMADRCTTR